MSRELQLIGDEIFERLRETPDWNSSYPSIYLVTATLEMLPILDVRAAQGHIHLMIYHDLHHLQYWALASLKPDDITMTQGQWAIDMWWE